MVYEATCEDNTSNYGRNKCMGIIRDIKNEDKMELTDMCELVDKNGFKTWTLLKKNCSMDKRVGIYEIIDSNIPDRDLRISTKCNYVINYLDITSFLKS